MFVSSLQNKLVQACSFAWRLTEVFPFNLYWQTPLWTSPQQPHPQSCVKSVEHTLRHDEGSAATHASTYGSLAWRCQRAAALPLTSSTSSFRREMAPSLISRQTPLKRSRPMWKKHPRRSPGHLHQQRTWVPPSKQAVESWQLKRWIIWDLQPDWKSQQPLSSPHPPLVLGWLSLEQVKAAHHPPQSTKL